MTAVNLDITDFLIMDVEDASCVVNLDILVTKLQENVNVLRLQQGYSVKGVLLTVGGMILQKAVSHVTARVVHPLVSSVICIQGGVNVYLTSMVINVTAVCLVSTSTQTVCYVCVALMVLPKRAVMTKDNVSVMNRQDSVNVRKM